MRQAELLAAKDSPETESTLRAAAMAPVSSVVAAMPSLQRKPSSVFAIVGLGWRLLRASYLARTGIGGRRLQHLDWMGHRAGIGSRCGDAVEGT